VALQHLKSCEDTRFFLLKPQVCNRGFYCGEETGESLKEKTEEAKRLLRYSDKSLTAIGSYLGFSSASHFSRVFKACAGSTRSEYRDKYL
jgi:YesN/AraC family two-component response regulator